MSALFSSPDEVAVRVAKAATVDPTMLTAHDAAGTICIDVPATHWHDVLAAARDVLSLNFFDWLSAVDEPDADPPGIDVVAHLVCSSRQPELVRVLVRTRVAATAPELPTVTDMWPGAAWHERETREMFGIHFTGFDDGTGLGLRPLLLPDGFEGTPLRKSFVLTARVSKAWPGAKEPGESSAAHGAPGRPTRRTMQPPGIPDPSWGPHVPEKEAEPAHPSEGNAEHE
ncbi:MAG: NADH-quinone oxidoreductase subunit C [Actinomycetota bacterium]